MSRRAMAAVSTAALVVGLAIAPACRAPGAAATDASGEAGAALAPAAEPVNDAASDAPRVPAAPARPTAARRLEQALAVVEREFVFPERLDAAWRARAAVALDQLDAVHPDDVARVVMAARPVLAALGTSHTELVDAREPRGRELLDVFVGTLPDEQRARLAPDGAVRLDDLGLRLERHGGATFVRGVLEGSPAARAGVLRGDRVLALDGGPYDAAALRGRAGEAVRLRLQRQPGVGSVREVELAVEGVRPRDAFLRALEQSARVVERDGRRLGVVHAWSWAGEEFGERLGQLLAAPPLADAEALVLDLRDGLGGAPPGASTRFGVDAPALILTARGGEPFTAPTEAVPAEQVWRRPLALLVDRRTSSGKEVLARALQRAGRALVVGEPSAGAVIGGRLFVVDDELLLYLAVADVTVDGERFDGVPVRPDLAVERPLPFSAGADAPLDAALAALVAQLDAASR